MKQNKLRKIVVAVTLAAAGVGFSVSASAAGLGRLTVLSSLGQPLRAEIDLAAVTREEAATLAARLASPDAFRQAGVDYNTALLGIRFSVQRRAGGQYYVSLVSSQPVNEPFLDLLVELNWATGRLVREYTFLLDPADMKAVAPPSVAPAPVIRAEAPRAAEPAPPPAPVAARPAEPAMVVKPTPKPASKPVATPKPAASAPPAGGTYEVKRGDTLGKIARQSAQEGVSLDQMLIALLSANPDAFVGGNVNRLKSGVILNLPDRNAASGVAQPDARRLVVAQATDFKAYQDKLAGVVQAAPAAKAEAPRQQARGTITAKVDDKAQKGDAKDQLKLSKADPAGLKDAAKGKPKASEEDRISKERALKESNVRVAELEKNVKDLQKLGEVKSAALADAQKQAQAKPPAPPMTQGADAKKGAESAKAEPAKVEPPKPVPPPAAVVAKVEPPKAEPPKAEPPKAEPAKSPEPPKAAESPKAPEPPKAADLPKMGEAPKADVTAKPADPVVVADAAKAGDAAKAADAPKAADPPKVAPKKPMVAPPPPEPSLMDEFLDNPAYLAGGAGVLALLGGYAAYAVRRKRKVDKFENSIITGGDLKANSVFGNTGGQSVDTGNSSFQSDFSQVGAGSMDADEVDPVAEADVYMAYGRDAQAEEILKEALQKDPTRHSVRIKLMEIYSQRSDTAAFETHARELHTATNGHGEHWERAVVLGQALLPGNPLFGSAATAPDPMTSTVTLAPGALAAAAAAAAAAPESMESTMQMQAFNPALDVAPPAPDPMTRTHSLASPPVLDSGGGLTVDFDLGGSAEPQVAAGSVPDFILDAPAAKSSSDNTLDFDLGGGMPAAAASTDFSPGGTLILEAPAFGGDDIANMETQPLPDMRPPEAPQPTIDFDFDLGADAPAATASATVAPAGNTMDFDLSAIDLDLPGKDAPSSASAARDDAATKLDLAKAYRDMGDKDGAKELLQEVMNEGSVAQKAEAKGLMATLG